MKVWRICIDRHAGTAFSGEGSRIYSGRWNLVGTPMVYAATSLALASIEVFVHLGPEDTPDHMVSIEAELPLDQAQCERVDVSALPADWRRERHPELMLMGSEWARSRRSLVLLVPSAAVGGEWNALVNPEHAEAKRIVLAEPRAFLFDERMFKK
jgi:RES domain-containing protein